MPVRLNFSLPAKRLLEWYSVHSSMKNPNVTGQDAFNALFLKWLSETGPDTRGIAVYFYGEHHGTLLIQINGDGPKFEALARYMEQASSHG